MNILIKNGTFVNEGVCFYGSLVVEGDHIASILTGDKQPKDTEFDKIIDASGAYVLPGVIDSHVHFREPGLTNKADIESESRAAAYGGVTSYFDMPNTNPQTTTLETLDQKFDIAAEKSHVNYSFFYGATGDNIDTFSWLDKQSIPGVKLFMGSSTGNMQLKEEDALKMIFQKAAEENLLVVTHCEDMTTINHHLLWWKSHGGENPPMKNYPLMRTWQACLKSTRKAISLAEKYGTRLHVAHISTSEELELFKPQHVKITAEAVIAHLMFTDNDYDRLGTLIKCNPSIKSWQARYELRKALNDGRISTVATDHAPHELRDKEGTVYTAASGMPMIQFSLVSMLELVDGGWITLPTLVDLMAHRPAILFNVNERGFLREGYKADITIVRPNSPWTVTKDCIQSKCKWSPMEGHTYQWKVDKTICNGQVIYDNGEFDEKSQGEQISFKKA